MSDHWGDIKGVENNLGMKILFNSSGITFLMKVSFLFWVDSEREKRGSKTLAEASPVLAEYRTKSKIKYTKIEIKLRIN